MFFCSYVVNIKTHIFVSTKNYMEQEIQLNGHNKQEYPPMHTAEHILNQTMIRMFGCERSKNTHIEKNQNAIIFYPSSQLRKWSQK